MKSKDYWKKRSEQITAKQLKKVDDYILELQLEYQEALYSIQKDIESFYSRFAVNNEISLKEARRLLNSNELQEFKMTLEEFKRKAKNDTDGIWTQELNNVYYKTRISRLEALQAQINVKINSLFSSQKNSTEELLANIYEDTYYRNIYEIHKGIGIGISFAKLDDRLIQKAISEPWHEGNYSSRIWNNRNKLIMELQTNLTQAFIRGDSVDKTAKAIAERMNAAKNRARTLVNTESAYISSKATFDSYIESGVVKQYEILATLDLRTSEICRSLDGKVFKLSEKQIGVTAPPFHPNCRTTTVAYFEDDIDKERVARNAHGKVYYVDGNMKYSEWHEKYIDNNEIAVTKEEDNKKINLQLFAIDEKKELERLICSGVIDRNEYNECYNYFKECFKDGINTPLGVVYDKRDRYPHIVYRHQYMISKEEIINIVNSLKEPDVIYKTKDKFGLEGMGYVKEINKDVLLTIVRNGIITSYYPSENYISKIKRGEIIWERK